MSSNATTANIAAPVVPLIDARISVRWRDLDAFNHVNNSNYLTYLEEARLQWLQQLPGQWMSDEGAPVMAASELNYRRPIAWPAQLSVQLFCEKLGNTSMVVGHRIVDADDAERVYCDGRVVMVWMNPKTGKSTPLPTVVRATGG
ncbi:thioesterase family protein [Dyella sp.]|uniref:acyl-CoA thioesterase n=1 Tax=Dyella sp. TaxID=1869338 RepID=UPI002ED1BD88